MSKIKTVWDDRAALEADVARYNIKLFCKRLTEEADEAKRQTIFNLITEEKAKLNTLMDHVP